MEFSNSMSWWRIRSYATSKATDTFCTFKKKKKKIMSSYSIITRIDALRGWAFREPVVVKDLRGTREEA